MIKRVSQLSILRNRRYGYLTNTSCHRNVVTSSVFGDFQFKGREKSELKSSYDVVIVGAGAY